MDAPQDPFAVRRPAPAGNRPEAEPAIDRDAGESDVAAVGDAPAQDGSFAPDIELLDRAEATYVGAASVIDLVDSGDLDQAESLLGSLITPPSE